MPWFRRPEPEPKPEPKDSFEPQLSIVEEDHAIFQGCDHPYSKPGDRFCGICGHEFRIYQADDNTYPPIWQ